MIFSTYVECLSSEPPNTIPGAKITEHPKNLSTNFQNVYGKQVSKNLFRKQIQNISLISLMFQGNNLTRKLNLYLKVYHLMDTMLKGCKVNRKFTLKMMCLERKY